MAPPVGHGPAAGGAAASGVHGEARKLEERLGEADMGCGFLLQVGDYAKSFKDLGAYMFWLMLQVVSRRPHLRLPDAHAQGPFLHPIAQCPLLSHLI
jgi:hypothetical protein